MQAYKHKGNHKNIELKYEMFKLLNNNNILAV